MNDKFIGISADVKEDTAISLAIAFVFILLGRWDDIFIIGTPKAGWLSTEVAALSFFWQFLIVVVVAPIIEEAFFRFALFGGMSAYLAQKGVNQPVRIGITIFVVSVLFSGFHYAAYGTALHSAYIGAFLFSIIACLLMMWRQSQIPNTVLHMVINGAIFWGIFVIV